MKVKLSPQNYFHPVYSIAPEKKSKQKFDWRSNLHKICFTVAIAGLLTPLITNPIFKEDNEELQRNIKLFSFGVSAIAATLGWKNETSLKTMETRRYSDMDINGNYSLVRLDKQMNFGREFMLKSASHDLETLKRVQGMGAYGLPYYPESLAGIAMQKFAPAQQQTDSNGNPIAVTSDIFTLPSIGKDENRNVIDKHYDYITDRKVRNYMGLLICGSTGDNKTTMMHYALYKWYQKEPDLVAYVSDRKYFSEENPKWRGNWCGAPVYTDVKKLTEPGVPHPSVYAQFHPDLLAWLQPVYKLLENRTGENKALATPEQKLVNPKTGKYRTVVVIIDDATMIIESIAKRDRQAAQNICFMIDELTTLGRSADIHIWFISHSNTADGTGLSTESLSMLEPLAGRNFVTNVNSVKWFKKPLTEEGVQFVLNMAEGKARGFATCWNNAPYLPPAPYSEERGMLDVVIPELTKMWIMTCPDGFMIQDYQIEALKSLGVDLNTLRYGEPKENQDPVSIPVHPDRTHAQTQDKSEKESLVELRQWANQNECYEPSKLIDKFAEIACVDKVTLEGVKENLVAIVQMSKDDFEKLG